MDLFLGALVLYKKREAVIVLHPSTRTGNTTLYYPSKGGLENRLTLRSYSYSVLGNTLCLADGLRGVDAGHIRTCLLSLV